MANFLQGKTVEDVTKTELGRAPSSATGMEGVDYGVRGDLSNLFQEHRAAADKDYVDVYENRLQRKQNIKENLGKAAKWGFLGAVTLAGAGTAYGMAKGKTATGVYDDAMSIPEGIWDFGKEGWGHVAGLNDPPPNLVGAQAWGKTPHPETGATGEPAFFDLLSDINVGSGATKEPPFYDEALEQFREFGIGDAEGFAERLTKVTGQIATSLFGEGFGKYTNYGGAGYYTPVLYALGGLIGLWAWSKIKPLKAISDLYYDTFPSRANTKLMRAENNELYAKEQRADFDDKFSIARTRWNLDKKRRALIRHADRLAGR